MSTHQAVHLGTNLGRVTASYGDYDWMPQHQILSKRGAILLHGAGTPDQYCGISWSASVILAMRLASMGIPCIAAAMGSDGFANDTNLGYVTTAGGVLDAAVAASGIAGASDYVAGAWHLFGTSMGGGVAAMYAARNPTKVKSIQGMVPMASIIDLYERNPLGLFTTGIATPWARTTALVSITTVNGSANITGTFTAGQNGYKVVTNTGSAIGVPVGTTITYVDATHATLSANATASATVTVLLAQPLPVSGGANNADILAQAPAIATAAIPNRWFYDATTDPYIAPATVTALAAAAGGTAIARSGSGHSNATALLVNAYNGKTDGQDIGDYMLAAA